MSIYEIPFQDAHGQTTSLESLRGKVILVVNVASQCLFTTQYDGLQALNEVYGPRGFTVAAFPCDQFGNQEPGSNDEIQEFCRLNFGVKFPVYAKIDVNGAKTAPIYEYLKKQKPGLFGTSAIKWNFTKFLVAKDGKVIKRYPPNVTPKSIRNDIERALTAKPD